MRILIYGINFSPELTGVGKYSGEMAEWLTARGHDVRIVTAPPYYPEWKIGKEYLAYKYKKEYSNGLTLWRCPLWVPNKLSGPKRILHLASFALSSLPVMLRQIFWKPDIIMMIEPPLFCAPTAWFVSRMSGAKCWLHIQDFEVDAAFDLGIIRFTWIKKITSVIERWLMRRFDAVSTISNSMMEKAKSKGVRDSKLLMFPNWVDTQQIFPSNKENILRAELGISAKNVVMLYAGNMGEKQGLENVIEAARRLRDESGLKFIMCGYGAAYERLHEMANGLSNIYWLPLQPIGRLNDLLNAADIHLLPQRVDVADLVMPSKLTGMMASGRPVVAITNPNTEVWRVVQNCGVTVSPGDVKSFVDAILLLANDSDRRTKLGIAARQYAEQRLDHEVVLSCLEKELISIVNQK